jgi:hypothetical protein
MRYLLVSFVVLFLFSGCVNSEPQPEVQKKPDVNNTNVTEVQVIEKNVSIISQLVDEKVIEDESLEEVNLIANVFSDELYFEKDKEGIDKHRLVIKYLDARDWEKKALKKIYKKHKKLWSKKQSKDLWKIVEEDRYFGLCSDRKYWDNLQFEESEPERDVLHSILLIRYLNNLSNGCPEWIRSKQKIQNENRQEYINSKEILSLLPHNVLIEKLIMIYVSKSKRFKTMIDEHHASLSLDKKEEEILAERLAIEAYKREEKSPKYEKRK